MWKRIFLYISIYRTNLWTNTFFEGEVYRIYGECDVQLTQGWTSPSNVRPKIKIQSKTSTGWTGNLHSSKPVRLFIVFFYFPRFSCCHFSEFEKNFLCSFLYILLPFWSISKTQNAPRPPHSRAEEVNSPRFACGFSVVIFGMEYFAGFLWPRDYPWIWNLGRTRITATYGRSFSKNLKGNLEMSSILPSTQTSWRIRYGTIWWRNTEKKKRGKRLRVGAVGLRSFLKTSIANSELALTWILENTSQLQVLCLIDWLPIMFTSWVFVRLIDWLAFYRSVDCLIWLLFACRFWPTVYLIWLLLHWSNVFFNSNFDKSWYLLLTLVCSGIGGKVTNLPDITVKRAVKATQDTFGNSSDTSQRNLFEDPYAEWELSNLAHIDRSIDCWTVWCRIDWFVDRWTVSLIDWLIDWLINGSIQ